MLEVFKDRRPLAQIGGHGHYLYDEPAEWILLKPPTAGERARYRPSVVLCCGCDRIMGRRRHSLHAFWQGVRAYCRQVKWSLMHRWELHIEEQERIWERGRR